MEPAKFDFGKGVLDTVNAGIAGVFQYKTAKEQAKGVSTLPAAPRAAKAKPGKMNTLILVGGAAVALVLVLSLAGRRR